MSVKILIVEDEAIIAAEIESIVETLGYRVLAKTRNGDKALDLLANHNFDLALLDITIKGSLSGIDLAKIIKEKYDFPYVFLTSHSDIDTLNQVKETLPYGYIVKPFSEHDLRSTIELALFKFQSEQQSVFPEKTQLENQLGIQLTQREYDLYAHLFEGRTYKEMAVANFISVNTVKFYLKRLFEKLEVHSRHQAANLILSLRK
jgi:DNA-binding NarL/FixJ family response regulator